MVNFEKKFKNSAKIKGHCKYCGHTKIVQRARGLFCLKCRREITQ